MLHLLYPGWQHDFPDTATSHTKLADLCQPYSILELFANLNDEGDEV